MSNAGWDNAQQRIREAIARGDGVLNLSELGLELLPPETRQIPGLAYLDLGHNCIDAYWARSVSSSLIFWPQLTALHAAHNRIGDIGACAIADSLHCVKQLTTLDLGNNNIHSDGVRAIANAIKDLPKLEELSLALNAFSEIYQEFVDHPSLRKLFVDGSPRLGLPRQFEFETNPHNLFELWKRSRGIGSDVVREFKVQFVGCGGNGKTCVWSLLLRKDLPKVHDATRSFEHAALELHDIQPPRGAKAPPMPVEGGMFNAWLFDYGGQSHLHGSHRFFLADQRNVWVIVVRSTHAADDPTVNRLRYWLGMIRQEYQQARSDEQAHRDRVHESEQPRKEGYESLERPPVVLVLETWSKDAGAGKLGTIDERALSEEFGVDLRFVPGFDSLEESTRSADVERLRQTVRNSGGCGCPSPSSRCGRM